ncbi:uncharacterized protein LOC134596577 [Pelobates fuscus]|uniref:uncharacterized protein LOC134596577 n=1 Tax=Pelobates fuscus TaxID=191477 RepID=UPI002FE4B747
MWTLGRESHSQAKLIGPAVIVMAVLTLHPLVGSDTNNEIGGWDQSDSAEMRWKEIEIRITCLTINCTNMRANLYGEGYFSHNETESMTYIKLPNESFDLLMLESTTPFGYRILYTPISSNIYLEELTQYWESYANQQSTKRTYTIIHWLANATKYSWIGGLGLKIIKGIAWCVFIILCIYLCYKITVFCIQSFASLKNKS